MFDIILTYQKGDDFLSSDNVIIEKQGNIAILYINRPKALNALNTDLLKGLNCAIDKLMNDEDTYVVILTGKGKAFVAGADIGEMKDMTPVEARAFADKGLSLFRKIELMDKPIIASVNGFALGGGCELSMACDIRIASDRAKFGQPEVGLGITPGFGGTQRLSRLVGEGRAKELIFTADVIGADEAYRIGLVNQVVESDKLMDTAMEMANKIVSKGQLAIRYSKDAINRGGQVDLDTGMSIEKNLFGLCFASEDQKEGMAAFLEKRKPDYKLK